MYTAKIKDIKKDVIQATQTPFLDVEVQILNEKEKVVESRKFAYALDTSPKEIKADVKKYLALFQEEKETEEKNKEVVALHKKADATIASLKGGESEE